MIFSIDQNCHSLWDVLPKLQALARRQKNVLHYVEDVDVAFTEMGSGVESGRPRLARERYYRSGGADWGAALFYSEFLSRLPLDIRCLENYVGMKLPALAKKLGLSVDELYDRYSPSDNWQLIAPSYAGDKQYHRVIGDLSVAETAPFLPQLFDKAEADLTRTFVDDDARQRVTNWLTAERERLDGLVEARADGRLVELYRQWLGQYLGESVQLGLTSDGFPVDPENGRLILLEEFCRDYTRLSKIYNASLEETGSDLRPLRRKEGELPFFATLHHEEHLARTVMHLQDKTLVIGRETFPLGDGNAIPFGLLQEAGICSITGKAALLVTQVRIGDRGGPLALPENGSLYMPTAHHLAAKLTEQNLLPGKPQPVLRVRFHLLDRMSGLNTRIRLPEYLQAAFGEEIVPADEIARRWQPLAEEAKQRLASFSDESARKQWQRQAFPDTMDEIDRLNDRRRELAQIDPKSEEIREASHRVRELENEMLDGTVEQIVRDIHVSQIDYWDSRGGLLPWCVGLGGMDFYDRVVDKAEIYEEHSL
ncbi:MAG: hypothetical protein ACLFVU_10560 [Phycisphaerae bacterium]